MFRIALSRTTCKTAALHRTTSSSIRASSIRPVTSLSIAPPRVLPIWPLLQSARVSARSVTTKTAPATGAGSATEPKSAAAKPALLKAAVEHAKLDRAHRCAVACFYCMLCVNSVCCSNRCGGNAVAEPVHPNGAVYASAPGASESYYELVGCWAVESETFGSYCVFSVCPIV